MLFENCIVDASILEGAVPSFVGGGGSPPVQFFLLVSVFSLRFLCCPRALCVWGCEVFKGVRWMPWHREPMKDVGICDKPGGVDNRTVIPGCPNGETPPHVMCGDLPLNA